MNLIFLQFCQKSFCKFCYVLISVLLVWFDQTFCKIFLCPHRLGVQGGTITTETNVGMTIFLLITNYCEPEVEVIIIDRILVNKGNFRVVQVHMMKASTINTGVGRTSGSVLDGQWEEHTLPEMAISSKSKIYKHWHFLPF